jgi:hypothetical protein
LKIAIFAPKNIKLAATLAARINNLDGDCHLFDISVDSLAKITLSKDRIVWDDQELTSFSAGFIHGYSYQNPLVPTASTDKDWRHWRLDYLHEQQGASFLYSLFSELERRGLKLYNNLSAHLGIFLRPDLLAKLGENNVKVPDTICTNEQETARDFVNFKENEIVLWRTITGRAMWQPFLERQCQALVGPDKPPVLLAKVCQGPMLRTYIFDDQPILTLKYSLPDHKGLERIETFWSSQCPDNYIESIRKAARLANMAWGELLYVASENGPVFYDFDPAPLFDDLPGSYCEFLYSQLSHRLTGQDPSQIPLPTEPEDRDTLFTRRMMRILFEFEESKYRKE